MVRSGRRALCQLLLALATSVVPLALGAQDFHCDPGDKEVRALEFRGNEAFSDDQLVVQVNVTASSWSRRHLRFVGTRRCLDRTDFPLDIQRLRYFYRAKGYYATQVDTLVQEMGKTEVRVVFVIREGAPVLLDSLQVLGLDLLPGRARLVAAMELRAGNPFDRTLLRSDVDSLTQRLRDAGYPFAEVLSSYDADTAARRAAVEIQAVPGALRHVGPIIVDVVPLEGKPQQIPDKVVRRILGIRPGDLYSDRALVDAQRSLYQLGAYRHVEVGLADSSAQPRDGALVALHVNLLEDYMRQLDTETGWATLDCFRTRAQLVDKNFLKSARRLELTAQLSKIGYGYPLATSATRNLCYQDILKRDHFSDTTNYYIGATLRQPGLFGTRAVPAFSLYRERRSEYLAYLRSTELGGEASLTKDIGFNTPFRLAYNLEYGRTVAQPALLCAVFNRCDLASQEQVSQRAQALAVASASISRARVDQPLNPHRGHVVRAELRAASPAIGSAPSLRFNKGTLDASWYRPLGSAVLALRLRGGIVFGEGHLSDGTPYVPPQERLYAGGAQSVRGFQQNELGKLVYIAEGYTTSVSASGDTTFVVANNTRPFRVVPVGGNSLAIGNLELRVRDAFFPNLVQYTFFNDIGEVWTREARVRGLGFHALKSTPGVGVRVFTPVGPVQLNVAYNPYQRPNGPIYYDAFRSSAQAPLFCVSPGNNLKVTFAPVSGALQPVGQQSGACPATFTPAQPRTFLNRLTFTFSVGPDF
ncbi:MAG: hypothetical protein JWO05_673 [Gemmatimonadetes bacterium]|nr:hypothetical protein [Gemmatimonadota bacterium]